MCSPETAPPGLSRMTDMAESNKRAEEEIRTMGLLMAHDLRNVFSVLNGLVILLERRQEARYLEMMKKQLDFCEQIVTSFVRFAEDGRVVRRVFSPVDLVDGLVDSINLPPTIRILVSHDFKGNVIGDPAQIRQILWNLLGNAVDACGSEPAQIAIRIWSDAGLVCTEVEDSGGGIAPEIRGKIMEKGATTKPTGLGLGLYLSRRLAEANSGRLECDSMPGSTKFRLWLPIPEP